MKRILLIEQSATLRHAAKQLMVNSGHDVTQAGDFNDGLKLLASQSRDFDFDAVLLGWPSKTDDAADELFSVLREARYQSIVVIVLSHEADSAKLAWVTKRRKSALVLWSTYTEINDALGSLTETESAQPTEQDLLFRGSPKMRVLFVDDSPTVRITYRRLLTKHGYDTDTACCVEEGMEKAQAIQYDIAIIDYYMPDGTGDTLCRMLRDDPKTSGMMSAIITGTYSDKAIISSLAAGAIECMFKNEPRELFLARMASMSNLVRAMRSVKNDHNHLEGILKSVGDGVYGVDGDGLITFINPAAREILGFADSDNIIGLSAHELFHSRDVEGEWIPIEYCPLQQAYQNGDQLNAWPTDFQHRKDKTISVECTVFPLYVGDKLHGSVVAFRDVTERKLLLEELKWQATHDPLTKLPNRAYFETHLLQEVKRLQRSSEKSALLYLDLDRFKYLNDTAGHEAGDQLLVAVGKQLLSRLRAADTLARIGGDEFAIILRNINPGMSFKAADKFRVVLEDYRFDYAGKSYKINTSIGIANIDDKSQSSGEVLANADIACYIAKSKGRNTVHMFESEQDEKAAMDIELGWSARLHDALKQNQFRLVYQPIASLKDLDVDNLPKQDELLWEQIVDDPDQNILHYEVLLRLADSRGRLISPKAFLPTAERFNMMIDIDRWVLNESIKVLAKQNDLGREVCFSINLSSQSLEDPQLASYITELTRDYGINPGSIIFEITETSAIANLDAANRLMSKLRQSGYRFALDDFGSGFCSFSHLKHLSIDTIKIDGIFIQGMLHDSVDRAIVSSIIQIAHSVDKTIVAEFVENVEVLKLLKHMGVDYVQGYYISRPINILPADQDIKKTA